MDKFSKTKGKSRIKQGCSDHPPILIERVFFENDRVSHNYLFDYCAFADVAHGHHRRRFRGKLVDLLMDFRHCCVDTELCFALLVNHDLLYL